MSKNKKKSLKNNNKVLLFVFVCERYLTAIGVSLLLQMMGNDANKQSQWCSDSLH